MPDIRLAIIGSRGFEDYDYMLVELDKLLVAEDYNIIEIVSGGARGADTLAERLARANGFPVKVFPADWNRFGKSAGFIRNRDIVQRADVVCAFWDGVSNGTQHSFELCKEFNKKLYIFKYKERRAV